MNLYNLMVSAEHNPIQQNKILCSNEEILAHNLISLSYPIPARN